MTKRRGWLVGLVAVWVVALVAASYWSERNDPPTVAEQRDIAAALPLLQRTTGALLAAASGPDRAVLLRETVLDDGCSITPVRDGVEASREVVVVVPAGRALAVLQDVARRLPAGYRAEAGPNTSGRRIGLHADAGEFIGIDAADDAASRSITLRTSTGCRPPVAGATAGEPSAPAAPAALTALLKRLQASGEEVEASAVSCPDGSTAGTWTADGGTAPGDIGNAVRPLAEGATLIRSDPQDWAWVTAAGSVVATAAEGKLRLSATTTCQ